MYTLAPDIPPNRLHEFSINMMMMVMGDDHLQVLVKAPAGRTLVISSWAMVMSWINQQRRRRPYRPQLSKQNGLDSRMP